MLRQETLPRIGRKYRVDATPTSTNRDLVDLGFSLYSRMLFTSPLNRHSHRRWLRCYITARLCWSCNSCWRTVFVAKQAPETRMDPTAQGRRRTKRTKAMRGSRGFTMGRALPMSRQKTILETRILLDLDYNLLSTLETEMR